MPDQGLLFHDDHEELPEPGKAGLRCTPELLWEFILETRERTGRSPSLLDCKQRYGGLWGPLVCGWELQRRGLLPDPSNDKYLARLEQIRELGAPKVMELILAEISERKGGKKK